MNRQFVRYLDSVVCLDALDKITNDLDEELKDSQKVLNDIKNMINFLPKQHQEPAPGGDNVTEHPNVSSIVKSDPPNLLLPDMLVYTDNIDIDNVIAAMKTYTEDMQKNLTVPNVQPQEPRERRKLEDLNIEQYAASLDMLCKRLSSLKLNKKVETKQNVVLEEKLEKLCEDVNMLTQVVQAKSKRSDVNKKFTSPQLSTEALNYDNIINKLLSNINEVIYLLNNKQ